MTTNPEPPFDPIGPLSEVKLTERAHVIGHGVLPSRSYKLMALCVHSSARDDKGAVVAVRFYDGAGALVEQDYAGCHRSNRIGQFRYVTAWPSEGSDSPRPISLTAPAGATRLELSFQSWNAKKARLLSAVLTLDSDSAGSALSKGEADSVVLSTAAYPREFSVVAGTAYALRVPCAGGSEKTPRGVAVAVRFRDALGNLIDESYPGCQLSPRLGQYTYQPVVPTGREEDSPLVRLTAPPRSVLLQLGIVLWRAREAFLQPTRVELLPWGSEQKRQSPLGRDPAGLDTSLDPGSGSGATHANSGKDKTPPVAIPVALLAPGTAGTERHPLSPLLPEVEGQTSSDHELTGDPVHYWTCIGETQTCDLSLSLRCLGLRVDRGAVVTVQFYDASRKLIEGVYARCQTSKTFGQFQYVAVPGDEDDSHVSLRLEPPAGAQWLRLGLAKWRAEGVHATEAPILHSPLGVQPWWQEFSVEAEQRYRLHFRLCQDDMADKEGGRILVEYLDSSGNRIPGPYANCVCSESEGCFRLVPVRRGSSHARDTLLELRAPASSATLRVGFAASQPESSPRLARQPRLEPAEGDIVLSDLPYLVRFPVGEQRWLALTLRLVHDAAPVSRGGLLKVQFLDSTGQTIEKPYMHCRRVSDTEQGVHLRAVPPDCEMPTTVTILTPSGAEHLQLQALGWTSDQPRLVGGIELEDLDSGIAIDGSPKFFTVPFDPLVRQALSGTCLQEGVQQDKAGLLIVRYYDADCALIEGPYAGVHGTSAVGSYHYLTSAASQQPSPFKVEFTAPLNAAFLTVGFRSWNATGPLTVQTHFELVPTEVRTQGVEPAIVIKKALELARELPDKCRAALEWVLGQDPANVDALRAVCRLQERTGHIYAAGRSARKLAALSTSLADTQTARQILGVLRELDTTWRPRLGGNKESLGDPRSLKVMHLMKVAYPFESTGGAIRNHSILVAQRRDGIDAYAVTPLGYPRNQGHSRFAAKEEVDGVPYYRLDGGPRFNTRRMTLAELLEHDARLTASVLRTEGARVIHAASGYRGYELALKGLALREHFGIPLVYEVRSLHEHTWGRAGIDTELAEHTLARIGRENQCMREADRVVTISETMRRTLEARGVPPEKLCVVPNAVDCDQFVPQPCDEALKVSLGLAGRTVLGYISNISLREGHDVLVRAVPHLVARGLDVAVLFVGEGPERHSVEAVVSELGLESRVVFAGKVDHREIPRYYSIIDLFVVPRRRDYASDLVTPLKPFEAMAMRRPVLVSDRPALKEIVEPGVRGMMFRSEDEKDLAEMAFKMLSDPSLTERLAQTAREWVETQRTWNNVTKAYHQLYEELLREPR